jgi:hypothetical protein
MAQLVLQLAIGSVLICVATAVQALFIAVVFAARPHLARHVRRHNLRPFVILTSVAALWLLAGQSVGVWLWALGLLGLGAFEALEPALYYSLSAYTTLGFGDVLPAHDWRVLGTMLGANGMLGFGLATAALVALVGRIHSDIREG